MADIFVSYARADMERARALVTRLQSEGWTVFWDRNIPPGQQWRTVLQAELIPAGCVVVLWSRQSVASRWVLEEADHGAKRNACVSVLLEPAERPLGFQSLQAVDLRQWDGAPESSQLDALVATIGPCIGKQKGVTLLPRELAAVLGSPSRHPDLGYAVNLTCGLRNELPNPAELRWLEASATGPQNSEHEFTWRLAYDPRGLEHIRRIDRQTKVAIAGASELRIGFQLTAPVFSDVVRWLPGAYQFQVRGWVNRDRRQAPANLRTMIPAALGRWEARQLELHSRLSDQEWAEKRYSDDAVGYRFDLDDPRTGMAAR